MTQLFSSYEARGEAARSLTTTEYSGNKLLSILFAVNVAATLLHYVDNILHLREYPDLPTTQASSIVLFFLVMMPFGIAGYWLYVKHRHKLSYYLLYVYCLLNLVVLGHYLPSRLRGGFWNYGFKIHAFIWLEAVTALALLGYVIKLHRQDRRATGITTWLRRAWGAIAAPPQQQSSQNRYPSRFRPPRESHG